MVLHKHSPMRRQVNHAVAVAAEFGLPLKWLQDYLPAEALVEYHFEQSNEQKPLLFCQLSLTLQFWAGGMTVAVMALAYEMKKGGHWLLTFMMHGTG